MKYLAVISLLFCNISFADSSSYELYVNKNMGISFEYPKAAEVDDIGNNKQAKVWFHVGEWPNNVKHTGEQQHRSPVTGILFEEKLKTTFRGFK